MIIFTNQILLAFSLYDLRCIILTFRKQIIAFKKGTFAPPAPPTERQERRLLPPALLSGVAAPAPQIRAMFSSLVSDFFQRVLHLFRIALHVLFSVPFHLIFGFFYVFQRNDRKVYMN